MSNKERLYEDLKRDILTMTLEPGHDLDETRLSAQYEISRTPLRDVFRQLEGEGYIAIRGNRGAFVSPMSYKTLRDFFKTAPLIYAATARLAAESATHAQIASLKEIQKNFRKSIDNSEICENVYWNDSFHFAIGEMADNQYLTPSLRRLLIDHARIGQTFWRADTAEQRARVLTAAGQHDQLIAAIEAGDAEAAVQLTMDHWALSREHIELFVRPDPLPIDTSLSA